MKAIALGTLIMAVLLILAGMPWVSILAGLTSIAAAQAQRRLWLDTDD